MIRIKSNKLTAGLKNPSLQVDNLETLFYSKATKEGINEHHNLAKLASIIANGVDNMLYDNDLGLQLSKPTDDDASATRLFVYDHFLLIDSIEVELPRIEDKEP
uniref:Uncharacterized protein n=1 Tax=Favella ehrenbergii TaxID=182087 RepID=A0A7S3I037_9SPIT|mmetsp:Transcript_24494/g.30533  ORF Transcript_24494/g.30533 Transcript_24494/m.30533 type:complete len:104 (+) Transcript_24494:271-582(+)